jgi:hypothetical protein
VLVLVQIEDGRGELVGNRGLMLDGEFFEEGLDVRVGGGIFGVDEEDEDGLVWFFVDFGDECLSYDLAKCP